jgi:hypothetical protein
MRFLPLLQLYWKRFLSYLPEVERTVVLDLSRAPPLSEPVQWWVTLLSAYSGLGPTTLALVSTHQITLFGRYQCHRPNPSHSQCDFH